MKKQLKFDIVEMDGDGNCLFRAVALQVYGDASMHSEVRRRCLEFMVSSNPYFLRCQSSSLILVS
jgi:OTU domain-containing protein 5